MNNHAGYDLVGDIHGHADELERLLAKLGYGERDGVYQHSKRAVVFLGDFIDRGPKIARVLEIAMKMVKAGHALAVLGNHELNALAFHGRNVVNPSEPIRPHNEKNVSQHRATLDQLSEADVKQALEWFRGLPTSLEIANDEGQSFRAVHACWNPTQIGGISANRAKINSYLSLPMLNDQFLTEAYSKGTQLYAACEVVLKGPEAELPPRYFFYDKGMHKRTSIRTRWFEREAETFQDLSLGESTFYHESEPEIPISEPLYLDAETLKTLDSYPQDAPPVFVGHYWLKASQPQRLAPNVACLDYSVAKGGFLCAYRWDGEMEVDDGKFVWTN